MSHETKLAKAHRCLVILILAAVAAPFCYAQEDVQLPLDDPNAVITKVLGALRQIKHPAAGRGKATMTLKDAETEDKDKKCVVDFVFKGPNSRADLLSKKESGSHERFLCEVNSPKAVIRVHSDVYIVSPDLHYPMVGYDFRPGIFLRFGNDPVTKHLQLALKHPPVPRSLELDSKGILHLTTGKPSNMSKVSFDTNKGFRPVFYEWRVTKDDGSWFADSTALQWAEYAGLWYVSRAELKTLPTRAVYMTFAIDKFKPNAKVDDKEFTLDGLGLPDGFPVSDSIEGITYRYGDKANAKRIIRSPRSRKTPWLDGYPFQDMKT
jgi:hypothetical protein